LRFEGVFARDVEYMGAGPRVRKGLILPNAAAFTELPLGCLFDDRDKDRVGLRVPVSLAV